jgi:hypothetical protein
MLEFRRLLHRNDPFDQSDTLGIGRCDQNKKPQLLILSKKSFLRQPGHCDLHFTQSTALFSFLQRFFALALISIVRLKLRQRLVHLASLPQVALCGYLLGRGSASVPFSVICTCSPKCVAVWNQKMSFKRRRRLQYSGV